MLARAVRTSDAEYAHLLHLGAGSIGIEANLPSAGSAAHFNDTRCTGRARVRERAGVVVVRVIEPHSFGA